MVKAIVRYNFKINIDHLTPEQLIPLYEEIVWIKEQEHKASKKDG